MTAHLWRLLVAAPIFAFSPTLACHAAELNPADGAKDEEAWVLIVGEGPGTLTLVEEAK